MTLRLCIMAGFYRARRRRYSAVGAAGNITAISLS